MAVTFPLYGLGQLSIVKQGLAWSTGTTKIALITSTYAPNQDTDEFFSVPEANEAAQTGYTAGGATLTCSTPTYDATSNEIRLDATTNPVWTLTGSITARYAVVYKELGGASTLDPLIGYVDFGQDETATDDTFTITWAANSVFKFTVT